MLETVESTRNLLQDTLDEVLITSDGSPDRLDNLVDITDVVSEMQNNTPASDVDFVQKIKSHEEIIPIISLVDILDTPQHLFSSRPIRTTRFKGSLQERRAREIGKSNPAAGNDFVQTIRSGEELIPTVSLLDIVDTPPHLFTSRPIRSTRFKGNLQESPVCENRNINPADYIDFVRTIESGEELIPIASLVDIVDTPPHPSTSRAIRSTRWKRPLVQKKETKKRNPSELSSISEVAPSAACAEPVASATGEDKPLVRSLHDCPVCLDSLANKEISSTICGHVFCTTCIIAAVRARKVCPHCRTDLSLKKIHPLFI